MRASLCFLALLTTLAAQTPKPAPDAIGPGLPLALEVERLQQVYGKVITYEDPLWAWRGETPPFAIPLRRSFDRPADVDSQKDARIALQKTLDAYHRQIPGPKFRIVVSKWGLHVVPTQIRDEKGKLFPATNPLDARVDVPPQVRSATEHFRALCAALAGYFHITLDFFDGSQASLDGTTGFEQHFAAQPRRFTWGTNGLSARDAIIDLLERSGTTYSWRLYCQEGAIGSPQSRFCVLNMIRLEI